MQKNSKNTLFKVFYTLLILLVVAKAVSLGMLWFLPASGVNHRETKNFQPPFHRYGVQNMLQEASAAQESSAHATSENSQSIGITNMILKALYGNDNRGVVVVATKSDPKKSEVISLGETFMGFTLVKINLDSADFDKGGKRYVLEMEASKMKNSPALASARQLDPDVPVRVTKQDISDYARNPDRIWKEISIGEVKENGQIKGFQVTRIDPKSRFAQLGLEKGDLIIKANNVALKSYKDALDIYQKIDTIESIQITFLRNNQEREIIYEIQ